jgi:glycosyltransferase involved in cell wall biosynthesis
MKLNPLISIGMPVYNGEAHIQEAIDSVLCQSFEQFELIISDNASTDRTEAICRDYANRDKRIVYIRQPVNLGPAANFDATFQHSSCEYFMWLAADDRIAPDFLQKTFEFLSTHSDFVLVMTDVINIDHQGKRLNITEIDSIRTDRSFTDWPRLQHLFFRNPTSNIFFCIYGVYRRHALLKAKLNYRGMVRYLAGSEIPFLAQIALSGKIGAIGEPLRYYRRHDDSFSTREARQMSLYQFVDNKINISLILLRVIADSDCTLAHKLSLASTTITSTVVYFFHLVIYKLKKTLGISTAAK